MDSTLIDSLCVHYMHRIQNVNRKKNIHNYIHIQYVAVLNFLYLDCLQKLILDTTHTVCTDRKIGLCRQSSYSKNVSVTDIVCRPTQVTSCIRLE